MRLMARYVESEKVANSFEDFGRPLERREAERSTIALVSPATGAQKREFAAMIRDISSSGALLEANAESLEVNDIVEIQLPERGTTVGQIVWRSGVFYGCQFREAVSSGAISAVKLKSLPAASTDTKAANVDCAASENHHESTPIYPEINLRSAFIMSVALWVVIACAAYYLSFY
jgi:hypothetical protein